MDETRTAAARGNGTPRTCARSGCSDDPDCIGSLVQPAVRRIKALTPEQEAQIDERYQQIQEDRQRRDQEAEAIRRENALDAFLRARGRRYRDCTLDTYRATTDRQRELLTMLRDYSENITENIDQGKGVVLFGGVGSGKDHALVGLAKTALQQGHTVAWVNGLDLFADLRDAMTDNAPEGDVIDRLTRSDVLVLSDPVPPVAALSPYQASTLLRAIDCRYSDLKPTWVSLNVKSGGEADERMGPAIVDRLRDGSLCYFCDWQSWRRAAE